MVGRDPRPYDHFGLVPDSALAFYQPAAAVRLLPRELRFDEGGNPLQGELFDKVKIVIGKNGWHDIGSLKVCFGPSGKLPLAPGKSIDRDLYRLRPTYVVNSAEQNWTCFELLSEYEGASGFPGNCQKVPSSRSRCFTRCTSPRLRLVDRPAVTLGSRSSRCGSLTPDAVMI
jgi:hypothetical protein